MLFGLVGASRTGKTTLAKAVAEDLSILYQPASITEMAKSHGFDAVAPMSLRDRVNLQFLLLEDYLDLLDRTARPAILDRTPIDMIGYLLAEFDMNSHLKVEQETLDSAAAYLDLCIQATERFFDTLVIVGPLENYVEEEGKPALNAAFQWHTQLVMEGAAQRVRRPTIVFRMNRTDFEERREVLGDLLVQRMDAISQMRRSTPHIH